LSYSLAVWQQVAFNDEKIHGYAASTLLHPNAASTKRGNMVAAVPRSQMSPLPHVGSTLIIRAPAAFASCGNIAAGQTVPDVPTWTMQSQLLAASSDFDHAGSAMAS
jgi:hypothetical protein